MTKTVSVKFTGTKQEVFQIQCFLKMCQDFNRLGVPFLTAVSQVLALRDYLTDKK